MENKKEIADFLNDVMSDYIGKQYYDPNQQIYKAKKMIVELYNITENELNEKLTIGQKIEKEHNKDDEKLQQIIALQHIVEDLDYYSKPKPKNWAEKELDKEMKEAIKKKFDRMLL